MWHSAAWSNGGTKKKKETQTKQKQLVLTLRSGEFRSPHLDRAMYSNLKSNVTPALTMYTTAQSPPEHPVTVSTNQTGLCTAV